MKIKNWLVLLLFLIVLFTVSSQISQVTSTISIEEPKICTTSFYDEIEPITGNCIYYFNYTSCLNTSGPSTDCSLNQAQSTFSCKTGEVSIRRNSTECNSLNKFVVTIADGIAVQKKEIDFSNWGICVNSTENGCLAITCGSQQGGSAHNGIFNGCDGGKSCQKFLFCPDGTKKILYKASRSDFVQEDPTFKLNPLAAREVGP